MVEVSIHNIYINRSFQENTKALKILPRSSLEIALFTPIVFNPFEQCVAYQTDL